MASRAQVSLLLSCLLSIGAIAVAVALFGNRHCTDASACDDDAIAWVVGLPVGLLGLAMLAGASIGWSKDPRLAAQVSCTIWACVLLAGGAAIGGAASVFGILLAVLAVAMGALSVWVSG